MTFYIPPVFLFGNKVRHNQEEKKTELEIKNDWLGFIGCSIGCALWFLFLGIILILLIKIRMLIWNAL